MSAPSSVEGLKKEMPAGLTRLGWILLVAGIALVAIGYGIDGGRMAFDNVIGFLLLVSVAAGSIFLVALEYIGGAVWSVPMRRTNEFLGSLTFLLPLLALPLLLNLPQIYHWARPEIVAGDEGLAGKSVYLNIPFFVVRFAVILAVWTLFYAVLVRNSTKQDATRDPHLTTINVRWGAVFMPVFAITLTLTAIDWGMSLEAHWYSTIYGVYYFAGTVLAALAAATYAFIKLYENGYLPKLHKDSFYSLGALLFVFINFWAYIAFSQFLLIWYANLPDETTWFIARWRNGWEYVSILLIIVQFAVPYFALLMQDSKMDLKRLKFMAIWILCAHLLDLFWLVMPTYSEGFTLSWTDFAFPLLLVGLTLVVLSYKMKRNSLIPVGDPKLERGLSFRL